MRPGTRIRFNNRCAWPERIGAEGVVVDPDIFEGRYPADLRMNWERAAIVLLDDDPISASQTYGDGRWSCVTSVGSLTVMPSATRKEHDEEGK